MAVVKPTIHMLEREIHMIGTSVAVVWNTKPDKKTIEKDGVKYTAQVRVRSGDPYIDFVSIREYRTRTALFKAGSMLPPPSHSAKS